MDLVSEDNERSIIINIEDDPLEYISTAEMIRAIKPSDAAIDLVGVVSDVQNPTTVMKNSETLTVLNFKIKVAEGIELPVSAWNTDIDRIKPFIVVKHIIHLDSPYARPQAASHWTKGKNYLLTCRSNTIINTLGRISSSNKNIELPENVQEFSNIEKCLSETEIDEQIALIVAVRVEFRKENDKLLKRIGSVTDGLEKLTVIIHQYDDDIVFAKGEFIKMYGKITEIKNMIQYEVESTEYIKKIERENLSSAVLSSITKNAKRKFVTNLDEHGSPSKTMKVEEEKSSTMQEDKSSRMEEGKSN